MGARTLLLQSDRNRRMIEQELADTNETLSDQTCTNQAIQGAKSKCEQELNALGHDLDEMTAEAKMSDDKAQHAMIDAARLADELRAEQEGAMMLEEDKKNNERMQALVDQLQGKIKSYKKQIEEAEEIAALNLAKYRQVQGNLQASGERADLHEQALAKMKASSRAGSLAPM